MTAPTFYDDIFGHRMFVDESDQGMRIGALNGKRLWRWRRIGGEFGLIFRCVRAGQTALDIGANVGLLTLPLARQVGPAGRVVAFEPGPKSFELLARNVAANGYAHVRVENAAVSQQSGIVDLFICRTGESDNRIEGMRVDADERDKISVKCFAVDDYLAQNNIESVDFIKMDVQGAEMLALRGMRETLRRNARIQVVLEFTPEAIAFAGSSAEEMLDFAAGLGFKLYILGEHDRERLSTRQSLLENVGGPNNPTHVNIVLRR